MGGLVDVIAKVRRACKGSRSIVSTREQQIWVLGCVGCSRCAWLMKKRRKDKSASEVSWSTGPGEKGRASCMGCRERDF